MLNRNKHGMRQVENNDNVRDRDFYNEKTVT